MAEPTSEQPKAAAVRTAPQGDLEAVKKLKDAFQRIKTEIHKVIIGQDRVVEEVLVGIFSKGHCLLVGVPGLAKTLLIRTLAQTLSLTFNRIQFTPDLMPSDITGTEVIQEDRASGCRTLQFLRGPVFANVILADEINRTPPKTQAALLEAMQEYQVTAGGKKHVIDQPFFVLATQNPIEQEGTYPLPEAQLDRFMFLIKVDYPTEQEELEIVKLTTATFEAKLQPVLDKAEINALQEIVRRVPVADNVAKYAMNLARMSRVGQPRTPKFVSDWVAWGAGPRASQYLIVGAKARAVLHGRYYVSTDDIKAVAQPVLRHRIITNFSAEAEGISSDKVVEKLIDVVPAQEASVLKDEKLPKVLGKTGS
ncbi:MAG: MoxR family ATPase [Planctomycetota bacterium]|nr:MoxR family ATPase [Planctomycetota bacterium]